MGLFEGGKCAAGVIHLNKCITTNWGPNLGDFGRKIGKKRAKKRKRAKIHTKILAFLGISGVQIVSQQCPTCSKQVLAQKSKGG